MTSTFNALLSDVYRLLSLYNEEDFIAASRSHRVDPLIKDVMRALARPARETSRASRRPEERAANGYGHASVENQMQDLAALMMKALADSTSDKIIDIFSRNNILVEKRPKESKERLTRRLASIVSELAPSRRRKLLEDLADASGGQTAGWISVLRNRS